LRKQVLERIFLTVSADEPAIQKEAATRTGVAVIQTPNR
jgi:hypothetical protein